TGTSGLVPPDPQTARMQLARPTPTPFAGTMRCQLVLPAGERVDAAIYDLSGRRIRVISSTILEAGPHDIVWDGRDRNDTEAPSGVYFLKVAAGDETQLRRLVLVRYQVRRTNLVCRFWLQLLLLGSA